LRVELDGDWAELRHANKIPHSKTTEYRKAFYRVASVGAERQAAAGRAMLNNGGLEAMDELANALVLAVVSDWSYGAVDLSTLMDVPTHDLNEISRHCAGPEYVKMLQPDFDVDPDPDSPTLPSAP
jgi:hypothetical protein